MKRPARKAIPLEVKVRACLHRLNMGSQAEAVIQTAKRTSTLKGQLLPILLSMLGFDPRKKVHWDHSPALALRERRPDGTYIPDDLDPAHLYPMTPEAHARKTSGSAPGEGKATVANSDQHRIAKTTRLEKKRMMTEREANAIIDTALRDDAVKYAQDRPAPYAPKSKFPQGRKMQSRPFPKRKR